jgi:hypothetical protein
MRKHDNFTYNYGWRTAPEQWSFYHNGKLIELDSDIRNSLACLCLSGKTREAENELKRIIRKQQKTSNKYVTIGFYGVEHTKEYYFTKQLLARKDNLSDMLRIYKDWKEYILNLNCKLPFCTTGKLDGNFNTIEKHTEYNTVNINRGLIINVTMI